MEFAISGDMKMKAIVSDLGSYRNQRVPIKLMSTPVTIPNVSNIKRKWCLIIIPCYEPHFEVGTGLPGAKYVSALLQLLDSEEPDGYNVTAEVAVSIVDAAKWEPIKRLGFTGNFLFNSSTDCWGFTQLVSHEELFAPSSKFLHSGHLLLEMDIKQHLFPKLFHPNQPSIYKNFTMDTGPIIRSEMKSDFTIVVQGDTCFPVHRVILMSRSSVFRAMLMHDTIEVSTGKCFVDDVDGPIMEIFLDFLYTCSLKDVPNNAERILIVADKYNVSDLRLICEDIILKEIKDFESATRIGKIVSQRNLPLLKSGVLSFVCKNFKKISYDYRE